MTETDKLISDTIRKLLKIESSIKFQEQLLLELHNERNSLNEIVSVLKKQYTEQFQRHYHDIYTNRQEPKAVRKATRRNGSWTNIVRDFLTKSKKATFGEIVDFIIESGLNDRDQNKGDIQRRVNTALFQMIKKEIVEFKLNAVNAKVYSLKKK